MVFNEIELKKLYGKQYVDNFEEKQSSFRIKQLLRYLELEDTFVVADFACGSGMLMKYVAPSVKQYLGVDFSEMFIRVANEKKRQLEIKNADFYCSSINDFCKENIGEFDVGFMIDFSEHVYDEQFLEILKDIKLSLRQNGKLFLHSPNENYFIEKLKKHNFILKQFPEHVAIRTLEDNISLLEKSGFSIKVTRFIPHYNVLKYLHFVSYLPIIGKWFQARIFIEAVARK